MKKIYVMVLSSLFQRGNLAIHHAAMVGHADIVQTLIEAGSQIDTQEKVNMTKLTRHSGWIWVPALQAISHFFCL